MTSPVKRPGLVKGLAGAVAALVAAAGVQVGVVVDNLMEDVDRLEATVARQRTAATADARSLLADVAGIEARISSDLTGALASLPALTERIAVAASTAAGATVRDVLAQVAPVLARIEAALAAIPTRFDVGADVRAQVDIDAHVLAPLVTDALALVRQLLASLSVPIPPG